MITWFYRLKLVVNIVLLSFIHQILFPLVVSAASGPAKPEAAQFEPVDASDMVNLFTGDFAYNLPLTSVPGPEGGWPIAMSYHSGIGPNTEATWVGLGWTLNPGAINRFVSGAPDDYWGGFMESTIEVKKVKGWGVSAGLSYGPVGMSLNYDSYSSKLGANASFSLIQGLMNLIPATALGMAAKSVSNIGGSNIGLDLSVNVGTSGVGLSAGLSYQTAGTIHGSVGVSASVQSGQKPSVGGSAGLSASRSETLYDTQSIMGVSFSSNQKGASFSVAGASGFSQGSSGPKGSGHTSAGGISIPIPLGHSGWFLNIGYSHWQWWLKEIHQDFTFGAINQLGYLNNADNKIGKIWNTPNNAVKEYDKYYENESKIELTKNTNSDNLATITSNSNKKRGWDLFRSTKFENKNVNDLLFSSEDVYQVSAQGINGTFRPYFTYPYGMRDIDDDNGGEFDQSFDLPGPASPNFPSNTGDKIAFRFDGEQGKNFIAELGADSYQRFTDSFYGSKKIVPAVDTTSGALRGFVITDTDGKRYEFFKPVYTYYSYSYTKAKKLKNSQKNITPYATSWLLTGVKGPDYIDRGVNGFSSDDWGFWVSFIYEGAKAGYVWRTPNTPGEMVPMGDGSAQGFSTGISENIYLKYIETATHIASFETGFRYDSKSSSIEQIELPVQNINVNSAGNYQLEFPFDKSYLVSLKNGTSATNVKLKLDIHSSYYDSVSQTILPGGSYFVEYDALSSSIPDNFEDNKYKIDTDIAADEYNGLYKSTLTIYNSNGVLSSKNEGKAKSLRMIKLLPNKVDSNYPTDYSTINTDKVKEAIKFNYSHSLQPGNDGSVGGNGKLTLTSVQKLGSELKPTLPATSFTYGYNPAYNRDSWTPWNGYSSVANYDKHMESSDPAIANRDAQAWNLVGIYNSMGSAIYINYESDQIYATGKDYHYKIEDRQDVSNYLESGITTNSLHGDFSSFINRGYEKVPFVYLVDKDWNGEKSIIGSHGSLQTKWNDIVEFKATKIPVSSIGNTSIQTLLPVTLKPSNDPSQYTALGNYNFHVHEYFILVPSPIIGGGARVSSVSVQFTGDSKTTRYKYGKGYVYALPNDYIKDIDVKIIDGNYPDGFEMDLNSFVKNGYNQLGPSPFVGYDQVEVYDVMSIGGLMNDNPINGKMVNKFYTANEAGLVEPGANDWPQRFTDKSGKLGQMKAIEVWAEKQNGEGKGLGEFVLVKYDSLLYRYSRELTSLPNGPNPVKIVDGSFSNEVTGKPLGVNQQEFYSDYKGTKKRVIYERENMFNMGTFSKLTFYDENYNKTGEQIIQSHNIGFDANTGNTLVSVAYDSENHMSINETTPAYWIYPDLKTKNMLTQTAMVTSYLTPAAYDFWANRNSNKQYIKASSVTTWKKWNNETWRQNDSYTSLRDANQYIDFTWWSSANNEELTPGQFDFLPATQPYGWQRTSNITSFDRYSHPVEERGIDGIYTSSVYGYQEALPVAIAKNARLTDFYFEGFEEKSNWDANLIWFDKTNAHSGLYSAKIEKSTAGEKVAFLNKWLVAGSFQYTFSGWVYSDNPSADIYLYITNDEGGGTTTQYVQTTVKNAWTFVEKTVTLPGGNNQLQLRLDNNGGGTVWFDDIRLHPSASQLSTFSYDPLSLQVISMTDENNITSYFDYDQAGRLIRVKDQDKNILTRYEYNYGKK